MRARSQVSGLAFTKHGDIESVFCEMFQFQLDSTQSPCGVAREYFRIIEPIENSHDQYLTSLQIALNGMETGPDFARSFQRAKRVQNRLRCGCLDDMEQTGGMGCASADARRLKAAAGIQNDKGFATFG